MSGTISLFHQNQFGRMSDSGIFGSSSSATIPVFWSFLFLLLFFLLSLILLHYRATFIFRQDISLMVHPPHPERISWFKTSKTREKGIPSFVRSSLHCQMNTIKNNTLTNFPLSSISRRRHIFVPKSFEYLLFFNKLPRAHNLESLALSSVLTWLFFSRGKRESPIPLFQIQRSFPESDFNLQEVTTI